MKTHNHAGSVSIDVKVENFHCIRQDRPPTPPHPNISWSTDGGNSSIIRAPWRAITNLCSTPKQRATCELGFDQRDETKVPMQKGWARLNDPSETRFRT